MKRKREAQRKEAPSYPIAASGALRIALEDEKVRHFIQTNFSAPELKPFIASRTNLSRGNTHRRWIVEIEETIPAFPNGKNRMMNIVRIEIDPFEGKITRRSFFKYILEREYREIRKGFYGKCLRPPGRLG